MLATATKPTITTLSKGSSLLRLQAERQDQFIKIFDPPLKLIKYDERILRKI